MVHGLWSNSIAMRSVMCNPELFELDSDSDSDSELESKNPDSDSRKKGWIRIWIRIRIRDFCFPSHPYYFSSFFQPVLLAASWGLLWPAGFESGFGFEAIGFGSVRIRKKGWIQIQLDSDSRCLDSDPDSDSRWPDSHITAWDSHFHTSEACLRRK